MKLSPRLMAKCRPVCWILCGLLSGVPACVGPSDVAEDSADAGSEGPAGPDGEGGTHEGRGAPPREDAGDAGSGRADGADSGIVEEGDARTSDAGGDATLLEDGGNTMSTDDAGGTAPADGGRVDDGMEDAGPAGDSGDASAVEDGGGADPEQEGGEAMTPSEGGDGGPDAVTEVSQDAGVDKVDLLFVIDNSNSMAQEQAALAHELPRMAQILASGDRDGDGKADFRPMQDMHLGVVSTDMGAAGNDPMGNAGCGDPGDDGILSVDPSCGGVDGYLSFDAATDDPAALGQSFACAAQLGTSGCGQEQPLDAMLKALVPPNSGVEFFGGALGHGGPMLGGPQGVNGGFVREDAALVVVIVTDEDDCSVPEENAALLAFRGGPFEDIPLNLRCGARPELLQPASRYHDGLLALKPDNPGRVVFAAIAGIPTDLEGSAADVILDDSAMQFTADRDASDPEAVPLPSCTFPNPDDPANPQKAFPPRRLVEVAGLFGARGTVQSICQDDFTGVLDGIVDKIPVLPSP